MILERLLFLKQELPYSGRGKTIGRPIVFLYASKEERAEIEHIHLSGDSEFVKLEKEC